MHSSTVCDLILTHAFFNSVCFDSPSGVLFHSLFCSSLMHSSTVCFLFLVSHAFFKCLFVFLMHSSVCGLILTHAFFNNVYFDSPSGVLFHSLFCSSLMHSSTVCFLFLVSHAFFKCLFVFLMHSSVCGLILTHAFFNSLSLILTHAFFNCLFFILTQSCILQVLGFYPHALMHSSTVCGLMLCHKFFNSL